ncbi:hypothetical protein [Sphingomonas sp.]|uniref:hypothetical protein n=1 Tax=Sphingomonas sp. TaxID=28214 RepID=UPI00286A1851|nr:hypothetical protein [Sphingomonas sp.]
MALVRIAATLAALVLATDAAAQAPPKPLFAGNAVIRLTIRGPLNQIARSAEQSRVPRDAVLMVPGAAPEILAIQLSPRGITRLRHETCQFPPLRVQFSRPPGPGSLFAGQKRLKLVTHCRSTASFQQYLLLEYAAYRMYNQLTPFSHRVRLATIDYVDDNNRPITTRYGFFLEDIDDVAARNGLRAAVTADRVNSADLASVDAARVGLFEYMIGNTDWSMRAGPKGEGCCHNSRLLSGAAAGGYLPVPYDFDYSGLVNAPYAVTPDGKGDVLKRRYMGYCRHNAEVIAFAAALRARRPALLSALSEVPMEPSTLRRATSYLDGFFSDIADDGKTSAKVLKTCA